MRLEALFDKSALQAVVTARHGDPFSILGPHPRGDQTVVLAYHPHAERMVVEHEAGFTAMEPLGHGLFAAAHAGAYRLRAENSGGRWHFEDPYRFGPVLGPMDEHLFSEGTHARLWDRLGAHVLRHEEVKGVHFAVWAPNAVRVSVVGDWNGWDSRIHPMRGRGTTGVWELFLPEAEPGQAYKYAILTRDGQELLKADPLGQAAELRPNTASRVAAPPRHRWADEVWLARRAEAQSVEAPISIYEVHAASWRPNPDGGIDWDFLRDQLIPYAVEMGFTHLEFLPISEHPFDGSWGYQPVGIYAPTARLGTPDAFRRFVDAAHQAELGVLLDWVPAHFPSDAHGLAQFDGTHLYEHADPREGFHQDWNTLIYNFGRAEVANFLAANARYWLEEFHADGLRVDAVASMLYRDYSRKQGEWVPNRDGGRENYEAIALMQRVNREAYGAHPGIMTVAEESTAFPGVTAPAHDRGLGFGFKWNMGWMNDSLSYFARDPIYRKHHHHEITFSLHYAFSENFVLPISHDEVVHGKGAMLAKMPGDDWQRFANLRAFYAMMWSHPGKKLLFMGQEFAQPEEWRENQTLPWHLTAHDRHKGVQDLVRDLNRLYRATPALHQRDCRAEGFEWLEGGDAENSVLAWIRWDAARAQPLVMVANLTPVPRQAARFGLPKPGRWREVLNSDAALYGGSNMGNLGRIDAEATPWMGQAQSAALTVPPLGVVWLMPEGEGQA